MKLTKRVFCLLLTLTMVLSLCACGKDNHDHDEDEPTRGNQIGDLAYGADLHEFGPNGMTASTFDPTETGKITVINFWATWCGPCVNELPHFDRLAENYANWVDVVAVHCGDLSEGQEFIADGYSNSAIRFAMEDGDNPYAYYETLGGDGSIPYTVVLDADGIIRKQYVGAINYDTLIDAIQACWDKDAKFPLMGHETITTTAPAVATRGNQIGDLAYSADLPIITAEGIQDKTVDPTTFGKVTVLCFWGTWNGACVQNMPELDVVANHYGDDVAIVAIHQLFHTDVPAFIRDNHPNSSVIFAADTGTNGNEYFKSLAHSDSTPYVIILDENGVITHHAIGGLNRYSLESMISEAMGNAPTT